MLGTSVMLDGAAYTVVGVMPAVFSLPAPFQQTTDVWLPLDVHNDKIGMSAMARLAPGSERRRGAERELDIRSRRGSTRSTGVCVGFRTKLVPPAQMVSFRESLLLLTVAVALVLLIAWVRTSRTCCSRARRRASASSRSAPR